MTTNAVRPAPCPPPGGGHHERGGQRRVKGRRWVMPLALVGLVGLGVAGCSLDGLLNSDQLPPDVSDPKVTETAEGARAAYQGTIAAFGSAFGGFGIIASLESFVRMTGVLSDELGVLVGDDLDRRALSALDNVGSRHNSYAVLQQVRNQAGQAIGLLTRYRPADSALAGRLYALQGYTELFLAELYCSGIPLSTLDYAGGFTPRPGSSTAEVFAHAVALFDTALVLAKDNARFLDLARVGRARALLGLGTDTAYAAAASVVAPVADGFRYTVAYNRVTEGPLAARNFALNTQSLWDLTVPDREGGNGLDWRTSEDPRVQVTFQGDYENGMTGAVTPVYHPDKYATTGDSAIVLASGVEARLIEAEAALKAGDAVTWLVKLNALRTDGTQDVNGVYQRGSGGASGLAPLADPTDAAARVDLLFRERAFWLFLTGHRQGDLRRLIRQYGRTQDQVYPVGVYGPAGFGITLFYEADVTIPTPERNNPLFTGCASRGA